MSSTLSCSLILASYPLVALSYISYPQYDAENFLCFQYQPLCQNFLDEMGCDSFNRTNVGCPGFPAVPNNITQFVGKCSCHSPVYFTVSSTRVTQQLISNRIGSDINWLLEPWRIGPPYDMIQSYTIVCSLLLSRFGCPLDFQVSAADYLPSGAQSNFQCTCGDFKDATVMVNNIIIDKLNSIGLANLPIFSNPAYLSVPMSVAVTLIVGKLFSIIAVYLTLPPIIGFLLGGLAIQNILNPMFLKGAGYPYPAPASELKTLALIIVLMRAGLAIKFEELKQTRVATTCLVMLPYLGEFFTFMYFGRYVFGWNEITIGLFASIMAPLGPSVVISGLLTLMAQNNANYGYTPKQILISTPIEAVLAIILFGIFTTLEQTAPPPLFPWVVVYPLYVNCLLIPVTLVFSAVLGIILGYFVSKYVNYRITLKSDDYIWVRINRNPQMGGSTADLIFVFLVLCYTFYNLCTQQYIQNCSGVLVVFTMAVTVSKLVEPLTASEMAQGLKGIWVFAEVFLFTLTGTSLVFDSTNGPLYGQRGLDDSQIKQLLGVMFASSASRFVSLGIAMLIIFQSFPKHRQNWRWMLPFWLNCYIYQLPKATVQATLGGVAYTSHIIPGAQGQNQGLFISQATAFTVLIFAPLGTILSKFVGAPISQYLEKLDIDASWDSAKFKLKALSPSEPSVASIDDTNDAANNLKTSELKKAADVTEVIQDIIKISRSLSLSFSGSIAASSAGPSPHSARSSTNGVIRYPTSTGISTKLDGQCTGATMKSSGVLSSSKDYCSIGEIEFGLVGLGICDDAEEKDA